MSRLTSVAESYYEHFSKVASDNLKLGGDPEKAKAAAQAAVAAALIVSKS